MDTLPLNSEDSGKKTRRSFLQQFRHWLLKMFYQGKYVHLIGVLLIMGGLFWGCLFAIRSSFGEPPQTSSSAVGIEEGSNALGIEEAVREAVQEDGGLRMSGSAAIPETPAPIIPDSQFSELVTGAPIPETPEPFSTPNAPSSKIQEPESGNTRNPGAPIPENPDALTSKTPEGESTPKVSELESTSKATASLPRTRDLATLLGPRGPRNQRQRSVVAMMRHAWSGYTQHAWGQDELHPVSRRADNGWRLGLTLVDSLDTLYLLGMDNEFNDAKEWVRTKLDFSQVGNVNLFETTIRVLGGLLGAEAVTGDPIFTQKARELGDRLMPAFTGRGFDIPFSDIELSSGNGQWKGGSASTSEITTLQLEFKTLSRITKDEKYAAAAERASNVVRNLPKADGLVPTNISPDSKHWSNSLVTFGARGDSYYEYLLKQWLLTGKTEDPFLSDYNAAIRGMQDRCMQRNKVGTKNLTFVGTWNGRSMTPQMDHLVCFVAGTLALGASEGGGEANHMSIAREIAATCNEMYTTTKTGLAAEITFFHPDGSLNIKPDDAHNLLRPETVESLFYLYRLTGDKIYQEWGWHIFNAFEQYARVDGGGYSSLKNVLHAPPGMRDKMESFFLAETVKYMFLLFDDQSELLPLDKFVINTEAHPLRIYKFPDGGHMDSAGVVLDEWQGNSHVHI